MTLNTRTTTTAYCTINKLFNILCSINEKKRRLLKLMPAQFIVSRRKDKTYDILDNI